MNTASRASNCGVNPPWRARGLSLIELLIAMVMGMTLAAGVIQIYVGTTTTERDQEARLRMQEGGRFAINFLSQEVRMAGYLGCLSSIQGQTINNTLIAEQGPDGTFQPQFGIQGWEANGTDPNQISNSANNVAVIPSTTAGEFIPGDPAFAIPAFSAVPNSDIMRVWGVSEDIGQITSMTPGNPPVLRIERNANIAPSDFLILSDCEQADLVQACQVANDAAPATTVTVQVSNACAPGNINSAPISVVTSGADPAEAAVLQGSIFFVGKRNNAATNPPSLFRGQLAANGTMAAAEELIEGVESMQIVYGVNLDQDVRSTADAFMPADQVTDWQHVVSVRISLLIQSIEDGTVPFAQPYAFNGITYDGSAGNGALPDDNRVRRVFTTTVSLRNRALGT